MVTPIYTTPRLKPFIEYCWNNGVISFFKVPGIAIEMADAPQFVFTVCQLMDGTIDLIQIKKQLSLSHPKETPYLEKLLAALDKEYLIEDTSKNAPNNLTEYEVERWSRNIDFFSAYCSASDNKYLYQEKLKSTKVAILGLGGVGSNVIYNIAAMGVQNITTVDFDRVELANLNRQVVYNEADIGKLKVEALKTRILEFLPLANIEVHNKKISSAVEVENIIAGHDIVISAADQPREKILDWVNVACVKHNIPYICGGLDSKWATYYSIIPGKTGCMECWKSKAKKSRLIYQDLVQRDKFRSAESPNIAIMPLISILSGLIANELLKLCTGVAEPLAVGKLCVFDFLSSQITVEESWEKKPDCVICSH